MGTVAHAAEEAGQALPAWSLPKDAVDRIALPVHWPERVTREVGGLAIPFLGRAALVRNKRASGRTKDLADLEALGER